MSSMRKVLDLSLKSEIAVRRKQLTKETGNQALNYLFCDSRWWMFAEAAGGAVAGEERNQQFVLIRDLGQSFAVVIYGVESE